MRILKKALIGVLVFIVLVIAAVSVYVKFYGQDKIEEVLKRALERDVAFGSISYAFPRGLKAEDVRIAHSLDGGKFFEAQDIVAQFSYRALAQGRLIFESVTLVKPLVVIEKNVESETSAETAQRRYGVVIPPQAPAEESADSQSPREGISNPPVPSKSTDVTIERLRLKQGRFQYTNSTIDKDFSFALEDVYLQADQLSFPLSAERTDFTVIGRLVKKGNPLSGSSVQAGGWVNVVGRDMEAKVEIIESDGSVGMSAVGVSRNNDMNVNGEIQFDNLVTGAGPSENAQESPANALIMNALTSAGVKIGAKFAFKTKMDDFRPEQVSFSGNVVTK